MGITLGITFFYLDSKKCKRRESLYKSLCCGGWCYCKSRNLFFFFRERDLLGEEEERGIKKTLCREDNDERTEDVCGV